MISIETNSGQFYSQKDEDNLFLWLKSINGLREVKGVGVRLLLTISDEIDKLSMLDLIAAMCRYDLDLIDFLRLSRSDVRFSWIDDESMYWHSRLTKASGSDHRCSNVK